MTKARGIFNRAGFYVVQNREQKRRCGMIKDPISSAVDEILYQAIVARASDIHVHLQQQGLIIRLRIDGVLQLFQEISADQAVQILARFKILANLDVSDARLPQDGKCAVVLAINDIEKAVDLRFATIPSVHGEKLLIRVLDTAQHFLSLDTLGLLSAQEAILLRLIQMPYGLVLTTGPTGSGKTTTLYALLATIDANQRQVITLEDPVEYSISGIVQAQVNPKIGFSFEQGLRAMLRQDPDVMMIGEIRDRQTAQIAMEAALTGHLVLSTLHTKDSISSIVRLREMGIDAYLLTAALSAVLGQRIVRRLCVRCRVVDFPTEQETTLFHQIGKKVATLWRPRGCQACFNTGYYGRVGIYEICLISDAIREGIIKNYSLSQLFTVAQQEGFIPFLVDGIEKVVAGLVSFEELIRIID